MSDDELFLTAIRHCTRSGLITNPCDLTVDEQARLAVMRQRRASGEPVQYSSPPLRILSAAASA